MKFEGLGDTLREDWWKQEAVARQLRLQFKKHIVALSVGFTVEDKAHCFFYSGSLVRYRREHMWLTAGHVLTQIDQLFESDCCVVRSVAWHDSGDTSGVNKIPIPYERLEKFKVDNRERDVGLVVFGDLDLKAIRGNQESVWLDGEIWADNDLRGADGYYVVGIPCETGKIEEWHRGHKGHCKYGAQIMCLPVERMEPKKPEEDGDFWGHPGWFYGRAVDVIKDDGTFLENIQGMSGGPIMALETTAEGDVKYVPCAVQSGWDVQSRIVCGTRIGEVRKVMDEFLERRNRGIEEKVKTE